MWLVSIQVYKLYPQSQYFIQCTALTHKQRKCSFHSQFEMASAIVDSKIAGKKVVVFSKSSCPFCVRVKALLKEYNLTAEDYEVVEMDKSPYSKDMSAMQDYLLKKTGARSVSPNIKCDDTLKKSVCTHKDKD